MDQELRNELDYLRSAVEELLRRVPGTVAIVSKPAASGTNELPDPMPGEGIVGYAMRCAAFVGGPRGEQAARAAGALFGGAGQALVNKHGGVWKAAIHEFIFGDPNYTPDPRWADYRPGT